MIKGNTPGPSEFVFLLGNHILMIWIGIFQISIIFVYSSGAEKILLEIFLKNHPPIEWISPRGDTDYLVVIKRISFRAENWRQD